MITQKDLSIGDILYFDEPSRQYRWLVEIKSVTAILNMVI